MSPVSPARWPLSSKVSPCRVYGLAGPGRGLQLPPCWALSRDMLSSLGEDLWHNQSDLKDCTPRGCGPGCDPQDVSLRCVGVTEVPASQSTLPGRYRRSASLQEFGALCGHRQHSFLPMPGRLHRQLLRGAGGRMLPQPLPEWSHMHRLPGRLLLRGECRRGRRCTGRKALVTAFLLPKELPQLQAGSEPL